MWSSVILDILEFIQLVICSTAAKSSFTMFGFYGRRPQRTGGLILKQKNFAQKSFGDLQICSVSYKLFYRQRFENWSNVLSFLGLCWILSSSNLNERQLSKSIFRETSENPITAVQSTRNKWVD